MSQPIQFSNTNDANTAAGAVLIQSIPIDAATHPLVVGYDFNEGINYEKLMKSYATTGFQVCLFLFNFHLFLI